MAAAAKDAREAPSPTPVLIVTGYLGAGKSTLVRSILTSKEHGKRVFVLNNELASPIGFENEYRVEAGSVAAIDVFESDNGCACCGGAASFSDKLRSVAQRRSHFDLVVIETDGVVDPSFAAVFVTEPSLARSFVIVGVVTVVDASHPARFDEGSDCVREAVAQARFCDRLVINKMDLTTPDRADGLAARLKELNPLAEQLRATHSQVPLANILDTRPFEIQKILDDLRAGPSGPIHELQLRPLVLLAREPLELDAVKLWLSKTLADPQNRIYRTKGVLAVRGSSRRHILQGVVGTFSITEFDEWPAHTRRSRSKIVLIGERLRREQIVESACAALGTRVVDEIMIPFLPGPPKSYPRQLLETLFGWLLAVNVLVWLFDPVRAGLSWLATSLPIAPVTIAVDLVVGRRLWLTGILVVWGALLSFTGPSPDEYEF